MGDLRVGGAVVARVRWLPELRKIAGAAAACGSG
jgi:hypothetical protein